MRVIYKQRLETEGWITAFKSKIEKILKLEAQDGQPTMWYIYNDDLEEQDYKTLCYATGQLLDSEMGRYLGTIEDGLGYIWHYFAMPGQQIGLSSKKDGQAATAILDVNWADELAKSAYASLKDYRITKEDYSNNYWNWEASTCKSPVKVVLKAGGDGE